ncbi:MAG: hypothetical protein OEM46_00710, partial [Ignavibacteria bacterium]|nr:hypothetical protein [Ignavibacteria bacterium]
SYLSQLLLRLGEDASNYFQFQYDDANNKGIIKLNSGSQADFEANEIILNKPTTVSQINTNDIIYPSIVVNDEDGSAVTITITIAKLDDGQPDNLRASVKWWLSQTQYGTPEEMGVQQSISYNNGTQIRPTGSDPVDGEENKSQTDDSGLIEILIENLRSTPADTWYIMVEIQGIVYTETFDINNYVIP